MEHIIIDIEKRLTEKVPELKYIAEDWGQLSLYGDFSPVKYPCALIDLVGGQFSNEGKKVQIGLMQISITIADFSQKISRNANQAMKDRAMNIFVLLREIYKALHGWAGSPDYSALIRTSMGRQIRDDGARLRTMTFTTSWKDTSAYDQQHAPITGLKITHQTE